MDTNEFTESLFNKEKPKKDQFKEALKSVETEEKKKKEIGFLRKIINEE